MHIVRRKLLTSVVIVARSRTRSRLSAPAIEDPCSTTLGGSRRRWVGLDGAGISCRFARTCRRLLTGCREQADADD